MEQQRRETQSCKSQAQNPRNQKWRQPHRPNRHGSHGRTQCGTDMFYRRKEKEENGENTAEQSGERVSKVPHKASNWGEAWREDERQRKVAEAEWLKMQEKMRWHHKVEEKAKPVHQARSHCASDLRPPQSGTVMDVVLGSANHDADDKLGASSQYEMPPEEKARVVDGSNNVSANAEVVISQHSPQVPSSEESSQIASGVRNIEASIEQENGGTSAAAAGANEVQGSSPPAPEAGFKPSAVQPMRSAVVLPPSIQPSTVLPLQFGQVCCGEWDQIVFSGHVSADDGHPVQVQQDMPVASNLQQDDAVDEECRHVVDEESRHAVDEECQHAVDEDCRHVSTGNDDQDEGLQLNTLMPNELQLQDTCGQVLHEEPGHHVDASEVTPLKLGLQGVIQHEQAQHVIRVPVPSQLSSQISQISEKSSSTVPLEDRRTSSPAEVAVVSAPYGQMQMLSDVTGLPYHPHPYCAQTSSNHSQPNFWQSHLSEPQIMSSHPTLPQPQQSNIHQSRVPVPCQVDHVFIQQNVLWHQYPIHLASPGHHPDFQPIRMAQPAQPGCPHPLYPGKLCITPRRVSQAQPHLHFTGVQVPGQPAGSLPLELKHLERVHLAQPSPQLAGWSPHVIMLPRQAWQYPYVRMAPPMAGCAEHVGQSSDMTAESSGSGRLSEPSHLQLAHPDGQSPLLGMQAPAHSNLPQSVWWQSEVESQSLSSVDVHRKGSTISGLQLLPGAPAVLHTSHQLTGDGSITEANVGLGVVMGSVSSEIEEEQLSRLQKGAGSSPPVLAAQSALKHALNTVGLKGLSGHSHVSGHTLVQGSLPRGSGSPVDSELDRVEVDASSARAGGEKVIVSTHHYDGHGNEHGSPSQRGPSFHVQGLHQQYQNGSHLEQSVMMSQPLEKPSVNDSREQPMLEQDWHHSELPCTGHQRASTHSSQQLVVTPQGKLVEDEESSPCDIAQPCNGYQQQLVMSEQAPRKEKQIQQGSSLASQHSESLEWERPSSLHGGQASRQQGAYMPLGKAALLKVQESQQQRSLDQRQQIARSRYDPMLQQRPAGFHSGRSAASGEEARPPEISLQAHKLADPAHQPQTCGGPTPWDTHNADTTVVRSKADALIAQNVSALRIGSLSRETGGQGTERVPLREQQRRDQLKRVQQQQQSLHWPPGQALGDYSSQFVLSEELSQLDVGGNLVAEVDMLLQQNPSSSELGTVSDEINDQIPLVSELIMDGLHRNTPLAGDAPFASIQQHGTINPLVRPELWNTLPGAETAGKSLGNHAPSTVHGGLQQWKDVLVSDREEVIQKSNEDGGTLPEEEKNIEALLGMLTVDKEGRTGASFEGFNNRVRDSDAVKVECGMGNGVAFAPSSMPCSLQSADQQAVHGRGSLTTVDGDPRRPGIEAEAACKEDRRSAGHITPPAAHQKPGLLPTPVRGLHLKAEQQPHMSAGQMEWSVQKRGRRKYYNRQRTIAAKEQGQDHNHYQTLEHGQNAYQQQQESAQPVLGAREDDDAQFKEDIERAISESLATATATVEVDHGDPPKNFSWDGGVSPIARTLRNGQPGESGGLSEEAGDPLQQEHVQMVPGKGLANEFGQYNCFLNVVIQSLWHIPVFRNVFVSQEQHRCIGSPCVICALKDIFVALRLQPKDSSCQEPAISPTSLRLALCALGSKQNRFQEGQMHDASEFLLFLFECLHKAFTLYAVPEQGVDLLDGFDPGRSTGFNDWECKVVDDEANKERCLVHSLFGMDVLERMHCSSCKLRSRQLKYTTFSHNVNAKQLRTTKGSHPSYHFDELLNATSTSDRRLCDREVGGCGKRNHLVHTLRASPHVFTIVLGWQKTRENIEDIRSTLKAIDTDIDIGIIYDGVDKGMRHRLVSVACYYGQHYHCFALNQDLDQWIKFDDSNVKVVGSWDEVSRICQAGRLQPQVLFYEAVRH